MHLNKIVTVVAVTVFLAPCVLSKQKQAVPREEVTITSSCANVWQPILKLIDAEYPIYFIYDPWHRVSFVKASGGAKAAQAIFGGSLPSATVQLRSDPAASDDANTCVAEIYSDETLAPEVAKLIAALPGATIVPPKTGADGKQK
jgi:hypothetical protein